MAESIFVADAYASWLEQGVKSVQYLEMLTKDFLSDSGGLTRGSAFYGISMIDKLIEPGESFVTASSSNNNVRVDAAVQDDGSVAVMVLNLDLTNTADVTINVDGVSLGSTGTKHTLTGGTTLSSEAATELGNTFAVNMPTRSIATFVIPAMVTLAGDFNNDGVVDGADYVVCARGWARFTRRISTTYGARILAERLHRAPPVAMRLRLRKCLNQRRGCCCSLGRFLRGWLGSSVSEPPDSEQTGGSPEARPQPPDIVPQAYLRLA